MTLLEKPEGGLSYPDTASKAGIISAESNLWAQNIAPTR